MLCVSLSVQLSHSGDEDISMEAIHIVLLIAFLGTSTGTVSYGSPAPITNDFAVDTKPSSTSTVMTTSPSSTTVSSTAAPSTITTTTIVTTTTTPTNATVVPSTTSSTKAQNGTTAKAGPKTSIPLAEDNANDSDVDTVWWQKVLGRQKIGLPKDGVEDSDSNSNDVASYYLWAAQSKASAPETLLWEQAFIRAAEKMKRRSGTEDGTAAVTPTPGPVVLASELAAKPRAAVWGSTCPSECRCRPAPIAEVPLYRSLLEASANGTVLTAEEIQLQPQLVVRVADCIAKDGKIGQLMDELPNDTQFLSMLQGDTEEPAQLRRTQLRRLRSLIGVQMRAFRPGSLLLRSDALRDSVQLRLLNFHGVHLLGATELDSSSEIASPLTTPEPEAEEAAIVKALTADRIGDPPEFPAYSDPSQEEAMRYNVDDDSGLNQPQLVFLTPPKPAVLPFPRYRALSQRAALHAFRPLTHLRFLRLEECGLRAASWEMFAGLAGLRVLALPNNGLRQISDFAFAGAPHLRVLSLAGNKLSGVTSTALAGLLQLAVLDISSNEINVLSELSLPPFPQLRVADFTRNPVEAVLACTFEVMNSTQSLVLGGSGKPLRLQTDAFLGLYLLRSLAVMDVAMEALDRSVLRGMPRLRQLQFQGRINAITLDAFAEVPKMERLSLRNCSLRALSMDAFYALYGLQTLDLSHNLLSSVPPGLLDQQTRLRELDLSHNRLTELPDGFMSSLPVKMVRVDGNPWRCSCAMRSWRPAATNKIFRNNRYEYEGRMAPRCADPPQVQGWDVYHALRKYLRCDRAGEGGLEGPRVAALIGRSKHQTTTTTITTTTTPASVTPGRLANESYVIVDNEGKHRVVSKKVYKLSMEQMRSRQNRVDAVAT